MSNSQEQTAAPVQATTAEQLLTHARANNELLSSCVTDLRAFLSRATGESAATEAQGEAATLATGLFGGIDAVLHEQTQLLSNVRECILAIERLA